MAISFYERIKQSIGVMDLQICSYALWTKSAFVNWKVITRFHTDYMVLLDEQIHSTLHRAVRTMRRDNPIDYAIRTPATVRRIMKMRTKRI